MLKKTRLIHLLLCLLIPLLSGCGGNSALQGRESDSYISMALDDMASSIASSAQIKGNAAIAVVDFPTLDGKMTKLGNYLSEELLSKLFATGRFRIIERNHISKAIDELKFNASGFVEEDFEKNVGKMIGADAIVTGTIAELDKVVKINLRAIDVEKGTVLATANTIIPKNQSIDKMLKTEALSLSETGKAISANSVAVMVIEHKLGKDVFAWWDKGNSMSDSFACSAMIDHLIKRGMKVIDYSVLAGKVTGSNITNSQELSPAMAAKLGREASAAIVFIGKAVSSYQGEMLSINSVRVNMTVKGVNTRNGEIILSTTVSSTGLHLKKEQAEQDAFIKAGRLAAERLYRQINRKKRS